MILLGIILLIAGAVAVYLAADRAIHICGVIAAVIGLVLIVLGLLSTTDTKLDTHDHGTVPHRSSWS